MNSAAAAPSRVRPRRRGVFRLSVGRGRPAVRRHVGRGRTPRGKSFGSCAVSGGLRRGASSCAGKSFGSCAVSGGLCRGERSCAGQILSPVRRLGCDPAEGVFFRLFVGRERPAVRRHVGRTRTPAGQTLSLARRVGRPSPWGAFLRGANPFARAPCREAFAEGAFLRGANPAHHSAPCREAFAVGSVLARGKFFCSCAVSGGFRRGERFCAGQILSLVRRVGKPSPRRAFLRGQIFSLVRRVGRPSPRSVFLRG